jgi:hypothetical protein
MTRIARYCANCFSFIEYGGEAGISPEPVWIEKCDWCEERVRKARVEVERLEKL